MSGLPSNGESRLLAPRRAAPLTRRRKPSGRWLQVLLVLVGSFNQAKPGKLGSVLRCPHSSCRHGGADQERAASLIDEAHRSWALYKASRVPRRQPPAHAVCEGKRDEGSDKDSHLREEIGVRIHELREERHKKRDALRIEAGHEPDVGRHLDGPRLIPRRRVKRSACPP